MHAVRTPRVTPILALVLALMGPCSLLCGCGEQEIPTAPGAQKAQPAGVRTLTLGAYTTPREAYGKAIIPAFQRHWRDKTGEEVRFEESYLGSGAQARAIVGGFEADMAALSLEADMETIAQAGLITHDWKAGPDHGMVTRSIVVIAVRRAIRRGFATGTTCAARGSMCSPPTCAPAAGPCGTSAPCTGRPCAAATSAPKGDAAAAETVLADVLHNVSIMDKGARESIVSFEKGVGDAAITYENEVLVGRKAGRDYEYVVPASTILIENPVAVVDAYADKHGNRELAEAFVAFLRTPEAQRAFTEYGLRPVDAGVAAGDGPVPGGARPVHHPGPGRLGRGRQDPVRPGRGL